MEKERRTKALLLSTLIVVVATLSIAFAAMSRTLSINGIGKMDTASWSVYFNDLKGPNIVRGAKQISAPSISADKGTVQDINVKLSNPKDEISYTVDIVNDGTIDAEITMIKDVELTDVQKKVFEFKVTYTDTGEVLKDGDLLPAGDTKNITINIKFKDDITEFDLPSESQTINLSYQITYTQYDGGNIPIIPDGGDITTDKPVLATVNVQEALTLADPSTYHVFNGPIQRKIVESITFLNSDEVPTEYEDNSWDASLNKDGSVMAWHTDSNSNGLKEVYIGGNGGVAAPADSSGLFAALVSLQEINFNGNLDTSNCVSMYGMFYYVMSIKTLDLSSFNTSNVTNMVGMFQKCSSLTGLDLSLFVTSDVTDMNFMFFECESLISLDLSSFNTLNVTDMNHMFGRCYGLTTLNLSSFKTPNVTNMYAMFNSCDLLTELDLSNFNTSKVTDMSYMFARCSSLENLNITSFNTENVTNMYAMFNACDLLTELDLSNFNTSKVTDMSWMFYLCESLTSLDVSSFNTEKVTDMSDMFHACYSLTNLDISNFNTSNVTNMGSMFQACYSLTNLDISNFNTSNVTNMEGMFTSLSLTTLDLSSFNTSNVTDMTGMFSYCRNLININLSSFDTSNVTDMTAMFEECSSLTTLDLSSFDTSNVLEMGSNGYQSNVYGMFDGCSSLTKIKFNRAVFTSVVYYDFMFHDVPKNFTIYVKDETAKNFILGIRSDANVIIEPLSS